MNVLHDDIVHGAIVHGNVGVRSRRILNVGVCKAYVADGVDDRAHGRSWESIRLGSVLG